MKKEELHRIGKITKTSGFKGGLMFFFDDHHIIENMVIKSIFVEMDGNMLPLFIEEISFSSEKKAKVDLMDVDSEQKAQRYLNKSIYIPKSSLPELDENDYLSHEIIGFLVIDKKYGELGEIIDIVENSMQSILVVMHRNKEVLIPAIEEIIINIDKKNRMVNIKAPDGLIELYV